MKKFEIGIYKTYCEYFALGISGYKMKEIKNKDKHCLAFEIRNKLNREKINEVFIRPIKNGVQDCSSINESELEMIAIAMSMDIDKTNLKIKLNKEIYIKK